MTEADFEQLLDRFGGDPAKWPAPDARAAEALLAASASARSRLAAARTLDGWLGELRTHAAPAHLAAAIMVHIERPDRLEQFVEWLTARLWRPLLVGAMPIIAGFAIGFGLPEPTDIDLAGQIGTLAFVDIYEELDDAEQP